MFDLTGKIAAVTGAGSGIGQAIAIAYAKSGATVYVLDRDSEAGERVVASIGQAARFIRMDLAKDADCELAARRVLDEQSRCDILVNNAGVGHVGTILQTTAEDLDRLWTINVRGAFLLTKALVPSMIERGSGAVINMSSIAGVVGVRDRLAYTTSKFAIVGLTKAMALDHSSSGVRFNCICPGRVETPFVQSRLKEYPDPEKAYREMSATQLNGRMVRPEEVAAAAVYLAADESAMITGSTLMIDGGWSAGK